MKPAIWIVLCSPALALVSNPAAAQDTRAQDKSAAVTLETARALFTRADADGNGQLSASEATTLGFDARSMSSSDSDANQSLSRDEFIVGYHQFLVHQAKPVAADLEAESTRLQALRRAQRSEELKQGRQVGTAGANQPAPSEARQGPRGPAQRSGAESPAVPSRQTPETGAGTPSGAGPGAARRVALAGGDVQQTREEKLRAIQETLNRRLRNGELSDPEAKAAYERMRQRIDNALGLKPEVAPAAAPDGSAVAVAGADAEKTREEQLLAIQESLNKRLRNADLSQREALAAYARVDHRIDNALGGTPADPAHPAGDATAAEKPLQTMTPEEAETLRQRVLDAQRALTRRVRNGQVDPASAAAAQADLRRRVERAASNGVPPGAAETPSAPATERARRSAGDPAASPPPPPARPRGSDGGSGADASSGGSRPRGS